MKGVSSYSKEDKLISAVDCIIFGFDGKDLRLLLIKRAFEPEKGNWSLVGGFLKKKETLTLAAERILKTYTGLDDIFMEQIHTFSQMDRDPVARTISTAYYALINIANHNKDLIKEYSADWFKVSDFPQLIFDHNKMVEYATRLLRAHTSTKPIGFKMLPEKFTMKQLQTLYEAIWNVQLDKRNFINKMSSYSFLEKLDEKEKKSSRKGSFFYKFNPEKYKSSDKENFILDY